jgi:hypothetical protein
MCDNKDCPLRESCYRFTATPSKYMQTYADFEFTTKDGITECEYYWPVKPIKEKL